METQDGFILGVYNYCDRWCERCALTSRCRVFAEDQRLSLEVPAASAQGSLPERAQAPVLRSLAALAAAFEELPEEPLHLPAREDADRRRPWSNLPPAEADLHARVGALGHRLWGWLAPESRAHEPIVKDAVEVLQHFAIFVGPKVYRALSGRSDEAWNTADSDANGSAKAALLAFDRLGEAWLRLAEHGAISVLEAAPVLTELQRLVAEMEHLFPQARDFVRPGFDEPEAVAMLEWRERG
jgi:hypothetical protein